ncbi:MAG TPA: DNA polymerase III subunit delta' [Dissulfurispiraceae bacterium]|nr:DNA polymerase III subunit delta' [Dissulfurispiraceae bacterium]
MSIRAIIGQDKAVRILSGTLKKKRIPSALLLSGDQGIGKVSGAIQYAKALNCLDPVDSDSCDRCISCRKIDSGNHPDVSLLVPDQDEIRIDLIRNVEDFLRMKPYEGNWKIVVVTEADLMNRSAANAFLRTLEEPPMNSLIILTSRNPDRLPDTVRSRCIHVRFYPLTRAECERVITQEGRAEDRNMVLNLVMGRPGLASSRDFTAEREWFLKLLAQMNNGVTKEAWGDRQSIALWLDLAFLHIRDEIVFALTAEESRMIAGGPGRKAGDKKTPGSVEALVNAHGRLYAVKELLDFHLNKSISWNYVSCIMREIS